MFTTLRVMCQRELRKKITLPEEYLTRTDDGLVLTYFFENKMRFITFNTREEVAEFMLQQGLISRYTGSGKGVLMEEEKLFTIQGRYGEPIQWTRLSYLLWEQIKFMPSEVIHFAAQREYELQGSTVRQMLGLVIHINNSPHKSAA